MCYHQIMPQSRGLFQKMIGEAGGCDQSVVTRGLEDTEVIGENFATALNCSFSSSNGNYTLQNACIRSKTSTQLNTAVDQIGANIWYFRNVFFPVVGGVFVAVVVALTYL